GQRAGADRGPSMPPGIAEDLNEEVRSAVDHQRLLLEVGRRIHEPVDLDDSRYTVEAAECRAQPSDLADSGDARGGITGLGVELGAQLPSYAAAVGVTR